MHIRVTTNEGEGVVEIDRFPDSCPMCHYGIKPLYQELAHLRQGYEGKVELVFRCPIGVCQSFFISRYRLGRRGGSELKLEGSFPYEPLDVEFSDHISRISPDFCAIADQAQRAEQRGWKLVAGPGYRKALEFLVKDYLLLLRPDDADIIKDLRLGACIANYVQNEKVKATAARAAWLGNDETHYTRKWEDKDLEDLKTLMQLTVHWIEMEELTADARKDMPEGKK
jgi:hypothetical protein